MLAVGAGAVAVLASPAIALLSTLSAMGVELLVATRVGCFLAKVATVRNGDANRLRYRRRGWHEGRGHGLMRGVLVKYRQLNLLKQIH